ncbi:MAG: hypothetical protein E7356_05130 [Clostridiales bacterium]|nr:hypothetical protein [Clostridiales bacterium]
MREYFCSGAVVLATAGREKGEIFLVLSSDSEYSLLVNGSTRTMDNPKKKNNKHLHLLCKSETTALDMSMLSDAQVKNFLSNYNKSRGK